MNRKKFLLTATLPIFAFFGIKTEKNGWEFIVRQYVDKEFGECTLSCWVYGDKNTAIKYFDDIQLRPKNPLTSKEQIRKILADKVEA